jgi:hypothetical protein
VASHLCHDSSVSSQHADPALTVRPPAAVMNQAKEVLDGRGREIRGFVVACLSALNADPDRFLAQLAEHWPPTKPRGRPRRHSNVVDVYSNPLARARVDELMGLRKPELITKVRRLPEGRAKGALDRWRKVELAWAIVRAESEASRRP